MNIGQIAGSRKLELDLPMLVDTRLLIQANSGGGKSWLLRLIPNRRLSGNWHHPYDFFASARSALLDAHLRREGDSRLPPISDWMEVRCR
jgi:hypothetical protein